MDGVALENCLVQYVSHNVQRNENHVHGFDSKERLATLGVLGGLR